MSRSVFARLSTGEPPARTEILLGKAMVLGGSIAGLLAARVLADHAETVVIIERDELPAAPGTLARAFRVNRRAQSPQQA